MIVAGLVVALDQVSKWLISANLSPGDRIEVLPGFLDLVFVRNPGAAFGILAGQTAVIISISVVGLIAVFFFLRRFPPTDVLGAHAFALIVGGTVGNLIDRIGPPHYVVDFLSFYVRGIFAWPAFNVADTAITVGVFALIYHFYRSGAFSRTHGQDDRPGD